jgi:hypothetical protein
MSQSTHRSMYIEADIRTKYRDHCSIESSSSVSSRRALSLPLSLLLLLFPSLSATSSISAMTAGPASMQSASVYSVLPTCLFDSAQTLLNESKTPACVHSRVLATTAPPAGRPALSLATRCLSLTTKLYPYDRLVECPPGAIPPRCARSLIG